MRYFLIALVFAAAGFAGGYWLHGSGPNRPERSGPAPVSHTASNIDSWTDAPRTNETTDLPVTMHVIQDQPTIFDKLYTAWQIASAASEDQLVSLLSQAIDMRDPLYNVNVAAIFVEKWTAIDPESALRFIVDHPEMDQEFFQAHVLTSWVRYDAAAALAYFRQIDNRQVKIAVASRLLEDPTLAGQGLESEIEEEIGPIARTLAERARLRRQPPEDAFAEALTMHGRQRISALMNAAMRWSYEDPDAAIRRIAVLPDESEQQRLMRTVLTQLVREAPDKALELLQLYAPGDDKLEQGVLQAYARSDPVAALSAVERFTNRTDNSNVLATLLSSWVKQDPGAALDYAITLPREQQTAVFLPMGSSYARSHPQEAWDWALGLGPEFENVQKMMFGTMSSSNPELAERNIDRVQDSELRNIIIQQVATRLSQQDVDGALNWITRNASAQSETWQRAMASVANQLAAMGDPDRSMRIIDRLPAGAIKANAQASLAVTWVRREPERVEEIISTLGIPDHLADQLRKQTASPHSAVFGPGVGSSAVSYPD